MDDGQKTKENYRLTIRKLREENTALETQLKTSDAAAKETQSPPPAATVVVVKPEKTRSREQQAVDEMVKLREERTQLQEELRSAQRDIDSLRVQIKGHSLEQQATNTVKRNVSTILTTVSPTYCHILRAGTVYSIKPPFNAIF